MTDILFQPYALNDVITLNNRIAMAPLTRCMADDDFGCRPMPWWRITHAVPMLG